MRASRWMSLLGFAMANACGDSSAPEPRITLELETESVALTQGSSQVVDVTIARSNYDKAVALSVEGTLPTGVTATLTQSSLSPDQTTTFLTIAASGSAAPTAAVTLAVVASGEGVSSETEPLALSVTLRGSYALGVLQPAITVAQGGGGSATVTLARTDNNQSNVSISVTGAPTGLSIAPAQISSTDAAVALNISASAAVAPGAYPLSLTSSAAGHASDQTATLTVNVIAPPSTASITVPICQANPPLWFAFQNEGFPWQRVIPGASNVVFDATNRLAIAFAFSGNGQSDLAIYYLTRAELAAFNDSHCSGTRSYSGNVTALSTGQSALIRLGRASDLVTASAPGYVLENLPARPLDQVAVRGIVTQLGQAATLTPDRLVIRRAVDAASGTVLPDINFDAADAITLASNTLTLNGVIGGETVFVSNLLRPATRTSGLMQVAMASGNSVTLYSVPLDKLDAGDVQEQNVYAENSTGLIGHTAVAFTRAPADRTITLGPLLPTPVVTSVSSSPYARLRATLASQAEYPSLVVFTFLQSSLSNARYVTQYVTAGFLGSTPSSWEILLPDLSSVPGFQAAWMPAAGQATAYLAEAFSGRTELLFGAMPVEGDIYREGFHQSSATALRSLRAFERTRLQRAPGIQPQYLRR
jgi:hypothetical protein